MIFRENSDKNSFDEYLIFSRVGDGSIGGKARGLAFINSIIKKNRIFNKFKGIIITIPRTVVLSTDSFDEFMDYYVSKGEDDPFNQGDLPVEKKDGFLSRIFNKGKDKDARKKDSEEESRKKNEAGSDAKSDKVKSKKGKGKK